MAGHDDAGRHGDPFDFREPPAPLDSARPPAPGRSPHSPFDFPGGTRGPGRRRLRRRVQAWTAELHAAQLSSPGALVVGVAVVVVLVLVVAAVVALL